MKPFKVCLKKDLTDGGRREDQRAFANQTFLKRFTALTNNLFARVCMEFRDRIMQAPFLDATCISFVW